MESPSFMRLNTSFSRGESPYFWLKSSNNNSAFLQNNTLKIINSTKKKGYLTSTEGAATFVTGGKLYTYGAGTKTYPSFKGTYRNGYYKKTIILLSMICPCLFVNA